MNIFITLNDEFTYKGVMMKKDTLELKNNDYLRVEEFIEGICADNHLHNYFGSISVAVSTVMNMTDGDVTLGFEKCIGGVCFTVAGKEKETFAVLNQTTDSMEKDSLFLVETLTDELDVSEDGSSVDLIFYVNGVDEELVAKRKELINAYSHTTVKLFTK